MRLHRDWKLIVARAWSVRLMVVAGALTAGEFILQTAVGAVPFSPVLTAAAGVATAAALVARLIAQRNLDA